MGIKPQRQEKKTTFSTVRQFIQQCEGIRDISKILIACNRRPATDFIWAVKRWADQVFINEKAIQFYVLTTQADFQANAEHVKLADHTMTIEGNSYDDISKIIETAIKFKVQGVYAGWGRGSTNAKLCMLLRKKGITLISSMLESMINPQDKIESYIMAQRANVPTLPWSGSELTALCTQNTVKISSEAYSAARILSAEEGLAAAEKIGYPVIIKGSGGKGIVKVEAPEDFEDCYRQVKREMPRYPIFVMKLASSVRHLKVPLLADWYGNAITLSVHDCSIQSNYRAVIKECYATVDNPETFEEMKKGYHYLCKGAPIAALLFKYIYKS